MPRYFLDVEYPSSLSEDRDGEEFDTPTAALAAARAVAKELLVESIRSDSLAVPRRIVVHDGRGHAIGSVDMKDVIPRAVM